jgi:GDPmannose 4,6-dehydratase
MSKKVLITGVTGQDGSYMVDYLLANTDYKIYGMVRRTSKPDFSNIAEAIKNPRFQLVVGDLSDGPSIDSVVKEVMPDYFINFAAQSFVASSWKIPQQTFDATTMGVVRCLEAIRQNVPSCRFYNAGSSEQFGEVEYSPQDEKHPFRPQSPYGAAKCASHFAVRVYRKSYNLYAIQGLLFNHEGPRRGEEFVTRKITKGVGRINRAIKNNESFEPIALGNIEAKRDWSDARDFVDGVWRMLNQEEFNEALKEKRDVWNGSLNITGELKSIHEIDVTGYQHAKNEEEKFLSHFVKEYILSSNETHTVREFIELAFKRAGIDGIWIGEGLKEQFILPNYLSDMSSLKSHVLVSISSEYFRPAEVDLLLGDSTLAREELGWKPKYSFQDLVSEMVDADL